MSNQANTTTLVLNPALYEISDEHLVNFAGEFYGNILQATNDDCESIEVTFEGPDHKANSTLFLQCLVGSYRKR